MEEIREIFRSVDTDGNGVISADEMEQVITDLGDVMTEEDIQQLRDVDVDGDGNINYEGNSPILKNSAYNCFYSIFLLMWFVYCYQLQNPFLCF